MQTDSEYLDRKHREISLLDSCLSVSLDPTRPGSIAAAIELKFRLAALLKADQLIKRGSITETARPPEYWGSTGPFAFSFGYQRADLEVSGPPIYPTVQRLGNGHGESTIYTGSGMSAIAALLMASLQLNDTVDIVAPVDCYAESRELMRSFGSRIRIAEPLSYLFEMVGVGNAAACVLWLDSSTRTSFSASLRGIAHGVDLVVLDTTCFSRRSGKIAHAIRRASQMGIPIALVRSHAKLDCLGIEYGRLGSVVLLQPGRNVGEKESDWTANLIPAIRNAVRLLGAAPLLGHFPPFESSAAYQDCSSARIASIMRTTRHLARALKSRLPTADVAIFPHGLYLTIAPHHAACVDEIKLAAKEIAQEMTAHGLPVKHAGSFGFDFVALEWYPDPIDRANLLRVCGGDLPPELADEVGDRLADWCSQRGWVKSRSYRSVIRPACDHSPLALEADRGLF